MKQVVIGTAGHIDHGKTALVKALTGMDTDYLPEEKERGMTIDLGFAFLTDNITIIDVPGHEKFIRNMVAGVSTINIALITIAADDGIMPQTREHIDILHLLGVKLGCIVITKIDLIEDPEWLDLLEEDIREYVKGSSFEDIPILRVSTVNGQGIKEVRSLLIKLAKSEVKREDRGFFRLFVDRVFTMKGFGTVVTGTVVSGSYSKGDEVDILPGGGTAKIRGVQSHGLNIQSVHLGDRAALNLSHVDKSVISRGSQLVSRGFMRTTDVVGAEIVLLPQTERVIRHEQRVRVHIGTDEIIGRVLLARRGRKMIKSKESSAVLIELQKEAAVAMGDPVILRFYSPPETIGGGVIIDPHPPERWKLCREWLDSLVGLNQQERLQKYLLSQANEPLTINEWSQKWQLSSILFRQLLNGLQVTEFGLLDNPSVSLTSQLENQKRVLLEAVENFHTQFPYKRGRTRDNLRKYLEFSIPLFDFLTGQLEHEGRVEVIEGLVKKRGYHISLSKKDQELTECIEDELTKARYTPPALSELAARCNLPVSHLLPLMHVLKSEGKAVEVEQDLWFHSDQIDKIEKEIRKYFKTNSSMGVSDFKSLTHTTRKHAIPLLEHFDHLRITQRDGDFRILLS